MFTFNVDLGQVLIAGLIAIVGYLTKRTIEGFGRRLDRHDEMLFGLVQDVQRLIGRSEVELGRRRTADRA